VLDTYVYDISSLRINDLTLILLKWRKWWAPNNASKWQMGFNSAFKVLNSMCYDSPDNSTCMPREEQAHRVSLHPGTGIIEPSAHSHTTAESQITNTIVKKRRNRTSFRAQRTSLDSTGWSGVYPLQIIPLAIAWQPQININFPSAKASVNPPLSLGVTKSVT